MLQLQILSGKLAGRKILVRQFPFRVGRIDSMDLVCSDPGVWDEHFQIDYGKGVGWEISSLADAGTLVGTELLSESVRLLNGQVITAGALRIKFNLADPALRPFQWRERLTWVAIVLLLAGEVALMFLLPR